MSIIVCQALQTALELRHPHRVLHILHALLEDDDGSHDKADVMIDDDDEEEDLGETTGAEDREKHLYNQQGPLDEYVAQWSDTEIEEIIRYVKEWNTNSKNTYVCQIILSSLLRIIRIDRLLSIRFVADSLLALIAYSERHYQRVDRLCQASFALELMQSNITGLSIFNVNNNAVSVEKVKKRKMDENSKFDKLSKKRGIS